MEKYSIAVIPGDGIGKEVTPEGVDVLEAAARLHGGFELAYAYFPWGCEYCLEHGRMMPSDGLDTLRDFDAIYFGAVGRPDLMPDSVSLRELLLKIRLGFDQYACVRPSLLLPGVLSPLEGKKPGDIDLVAVRENTEGEYVGAGGRAHPGMAFESAVETAVFTRPGTERVIRYAFELARSRPRKLLASVTKSNALNHSMAFWDQIFDEVSKDYPDVGTERVLVDAMAARMVLHPEGVDVFVASNLFGDILTDLSGAITGSMGLAPSANLNPERNFPSMFEPVHGSAPELCGKDVANPIAMCWSGAMMLEHLGQKAAGDIIVEAIKAVTADALALTPDLGGKAKTKEMTAAILAKMEALAK
ncbi:tartrate dehydrogenase [Fundidesulfovibrio butyratiphilus]